MKSYGGIWQKVVSMENLQEAWRRVKRGHAGSVAVAEYGRNIAGNLARLQWNLVFGTYRPGKYRQFKVYDPKPRTISCAPVVDRVVHHALCGVITPLLERRLVPVSFACREGFGAHAACALARRYAGKAKYFVKMDVRHYFDSISHERLLAVLLPMFREREMQELLRLIVEHPVPGQGDGLGLPIGNLTSQWFANVFLDAFDHVVLAGLGGKAPVGYLRYMDDFIFFTEGKAEAWRLHDAAKTWLGMERGLEIKDESTVVAPVSEGVPFLGLRIWANAWRLQRGRFLRTRRTFAHRTQQLLQGEISEERYRQCAESSDGASRWFGFKGILKDDLVMGEGSSSGSNRVKRGGSWNNNADNCTSSNRNNNNPSNTNNNNGFRLSSTLDAEIQDKGSHPIRPVLRGCEDEHALNSPTSSRKVTVARILFDSNSKIVDTQEARELHDGSMISQGI